VHLGVATSLFNLLRKKLLAILNRIFEGERSSRSVVLTNFDKESFVMLLWDAQHVLKEEIRVEIFSLELIEPFLYCNAEFNELLQIVEELFSLEFVIIFGFKTLSEVKLLDFIVSLSFVCFGDGNLVVVYPFLFPDYSA